MWCTVMSCVVRYCNIVCICHDGQGNYLFEHRSDKCRDEHFKWGPVGAGGLKFCEQIEDAVHREIKEECGADVLEMEYLGSRESFRMHEDKQTHWIFFDYKVRIDPEKVSILEPEKCLEHRWCKIEDVPEPKCLALYSLLEKYNDIL